MSVQECTVDVVYYVLQSGQYVAENMNVQECTVEVANKNISPLILHETHDSMLGGHAWVLRTLQRVKASFYWPKMRKKIHEYVAACTVYQTHKYSTLAPAGLLQPIELPEQIWEDVAMDLIEGLPMSHGGKCHIGGGGSTKQICSFSYIKASIYGYGRCTKV